MYPIGIAVGNSVSRSAVGISGVGCQCWNRQASICLVPEGHTTSIARGKPTKRQRGGVAPGISARETIWPTAIDKYDHDQTMASGANDRKQKSDDIRWAHFQAHQSQHGRQALVSSANDWDHVVAAND